MMRQPPPVFVQKVPLGQAGNPATCQLQIFSSQGRGANLANRSIQDALLDNHAVSINGTWSSLLPDREACHTIDSTLAYMHIVVDFARYMTMAAAIGLKAECGYRCVQMVI